jgi:hypothetical protein
MKRISLCSVLSVGIWLLGFGICLGQIAMPDPALIHGRAIPAAELPQGTVTVRVVREAIGNNVAGQAVRLVVNGAPRNAVTDDQGRAEFPNLPAGVDVRAEADVSGEALVSDSFKVPASGGLRVILVAGLKESAARKDADAAAAAAAPPVPGAVVIGPNSRMLMEFRDDALQMFYVLDILNNARTRVDIGGPLVIDLPEGAGGAGVLEGSSPAATVAGDRLTVTGPFAPGVTSVQVGFTLRHDSPTLTIQQTWPVPVQQLTVAMEQVGAASMSSPQFSTVGEVKAETGTPFLLASGPAVPAGGTVTIQLTNLPAHSPVPRYVALALAAAILGFGGWIAFSGGTRTQGDPRPRLIARRKALLAELATLETRRRAGGAVDEARRQRLVADLEHIYGELDEVHAPRGGGGGGEDVAA